MSISFIIAVITGIIVFLIVAGRIISNEALIANCLTCILLFLWLFISINSINDYKNLKCDIINLDSKQFIIIEDELININKKFEMVFTEKQIDVKFPVDKLYFGLRLNKKDRLYFLELK